MQGKLLTEKDAASCLGVSQEELLELVSSGQISAYRIAGEILRFDPDEIDDYRRRRDTAMAGKKTHPIKDRLLDLIYYNDFYIVVIILIAILAAFIFKVSF